MKKILILFIGIITLFTVGCGHGSIEEITFENYSKMIENKESFILVLESHECNHCAQYKVTLNNVTKKYNVDFKYLDIANLSEKEYVALSKQIIFKGTPTTVFIEEGQDNSCNVFNCDLTKRIDGALSYEEVIQTLKNMGYIKG